MSLTLGTIITAAFSIALRPNCPARPAFATYAVRQDFPFDTAYQASGIKLAEHRWPVAALSHHVGVVIAFAAEKEVRRVAAWRIVAVVQNALIVRHIAIDKSPRNAMGAALFAATNPDGAVTEMKASAKPFPAGFGAARAIDVVPEFIDSHSHNITLL